MTIGAVNDTPQANPDAPTTTEDTPLSIDVLANDADIDGDALTITSITQGSHGSVVINADGTVSYTPNQNFNGTDSFTYTVSDGQGGSSTATVSVTITAVNDAPQAIADSPIMTEDTSLMIDVLANDFDTDGGPLTITSLTQGAHGMVVLNGDGTLTYTPEADFVGSDAFSYTISDGTGATSTATVSVTITSLNDTPQANPDAYQTNEDTALAIPAPAGVIANDHDVEGSALQVRLVRDAGNGTVTLNPDGSFQYVPQANFNGTDTFQYVVSDGQHDSPVATVTITVHPVLDPLVLQGRTFLVPGTPSETVLLRFDWIYRHAQFNNGVGVVRVDDAEGRIGNLKPGDPGYLQAALATGRWQRVFRSGKRAGAVQYLSFRGGDRFTVFISQNSRIESAIPAKSANVSKRRPPVFFMNMAANSHRFDHVRIQARQGRYRLAWEDQVGGGDADFNDVVLTVHTVVR